MSIKAETVPDKGSANFNEAPIMLGVLTRSLACRAGLLGRNAPRFAFISRTCKRPYFNVHRLEAGDHMRKVDRIPQGYELVYYMEMHNILRFIGYACPLMIVIIAGAAVNSLLWPTFKPKEAEELVKDSWGDMIVVRLVTFAWAGVCLLGSMFFVHVKPIRMYYNKDAKFYYIILESMLSFQQRRIKVPEGAIKKAFPSAGNETFRGMVFKTDKQYLVLYKENFQSPVHYFRLAGQPSGY